MFMVNQRDLLVKHLLLVLAERTPDINQTIVHTDKGVQILA